MLKKDFGEVKKALKPKNGNVQEIWATYVNVEKTTLFSSKKKVFSLSEDEQLVYSNLFSKVLSGKTEKNLFELDLSEDNSRSFYSISEKHDEGAIEKVVENIIESYKSKESFAVLIALGSYAIPSYASDGAELEGSDGNYNFMVCAVCPTKLAKPSVVYHHNKDFFEGSKRDYVLQNPDIGFLYPTFEHREPNANRLLYFAKKDLYPTVLEKVLGNDIPLTSEDYLADFSEKVEESFGGNVSVETLYNINTSLEEKMVTKQYQEEDLVLDEADINDVLVKNGGKKVEFDGQINPSSLVSNKFKLEKDKDIVINASSDGMKEIKQETINGRSYLLIPVEDMTLNGVKLS
jgi:hypothetical protein